MVNGKCLKEVSMKNKPTSDKADPNSNPSAVSQSGPTLDEINEMRELVGFPPLDPIQKKAQVKQPNRSQK